MLGLAIDTESLVVLVFVEFLDLVLHIPKNRIHKLWYRLMVIEIHQLSLIHLKCLIHKTMFLYVHIQSQGELNHMVDGMQQFPADFECQRIRYLVGNSNRCHRKATFRDSMP